MLLLINACRYDHGGRFGWDSDRTAAVFCRNKGRRRVFGHTQAPVRRR